jgi:hypothetical protein
MYLSRENFLEISLEIKINVFLNTFWTWIDFILKWPESIDAGASPTKHEWRTSRLTSAHFEEI